MDGRKIIRYIHTPEFDPDRIIVEVYLNGKEKQYSSTELVIVSTIMRKMIAYLFIVMTPDPSDIFLIVSPLNVESMKDLG